MEIIIGSIILILVILLGYYWYSIKKSIVPENKGVSTPTEKNVTSTIVEEKNVPPILLSVAVQDSSKNTEVKMAKPKLTKVESSVVTKSPAKPKPSTNTKGTKPKTTKKPKPTYKSE